MAHIIFTVTNDLTYDQRMQRICRSLARAGYEVTLLGRRRPHSRPLQAEPYHQLRLQCRYDRGKLFYLEYNLELFRYLRTHPFDAVCAVDLDTALPVVLAARLTGKPCLYDAHEYFTEVPEIVRRPFIRRIWEAVGQLTVPAFDRAYTVGPALADLLEARYGLPFAVIRNVPQRRLPPVLDSLPERPIILYQGALNEGRGLEQAIRAMEYLQEGELWLAGEGDLSQELRQLTRRLRLQERVRFLGYLRPDDLWRITSSAKIGLNLLENNALSYYYSLANKAFDYIQAALPSLQMDFPEYRRLNDEYHVFFLLDQLTPERIALALQRLLQDEGLYKQLQRNCLQAAEELHWEREEEKLLAIYRDIL